MNIISPMAGRVEYDTGRVVINLSFFFSPGVSLKAEEERERINGLFGQTQNSLMSAEHN